MTFDELWRLDAASKKALPEPSELPGEFNRTESSIFDHLPLDDRVEDELSQFLSWLEESL